MIDVADNNAVYYYHYDGLGSVVALSDSSGDNCQSYEYSVYGQVAASDPNFITNPYLFTGRRFDYETGLYYYRVRYYNPYIGRFLQTDPIGYGNGINWYAYCRNNPLNWVDPSGQIRVAFYDPEGGGKNTPRGGQSDFEEAADDEYFDRCYPMNSADDVLRKLAEIKFEGIEVTEVFIFDHGGWRGHEFGNQTLWEPGNDPDSTPGVHKNDLEDFSQALQVLTSENCVINYRGCFTASGIGIQEGTQEGTGVHISGKGTGVSLIEKLAKWSNRVTTGATGLVYYYGNEKRARPDYHFESGGHGELWEASPDGMVKRLWWLREGLDERPY